MYSRIAAAMFALAFVGDASAEDMSVAEARHFVIGKLFSYNCFEGTRGSGRIFADGSVAGTIQIRGTGRVHFVRLPANTLQMRGESICASVPGLPFSPCFNVEKTSPTSFRGSIYGLRFAYCEFNRRGHRVDFVHRASPEHAPPRVQARHPAEHLPLRTAIDIP